ncbi:MAG: acyltransferase [Leptospiraceae bacterium]|nr:acyltransferase [Leptospiraceae bacterium]
MSEIIYKKRDERLDFIRGLAMVGIVLIHVNSYFEYFHSSEDIPVIISLILSNLSRFSVPVFIFSAGYFSRDKEFKEYWSTKVYTILLPFLIFSVIGFFIKNNEWNLSLFVYQILMGRTMTPYYFIPLLIQFYALYYLFIKYLSTRQLWIGTTIALGINYLSNSGSLFFIKGDYEPISLTNYIFFFFIGLLGSKYKLDDLINDSIKRYTIRIAFLCLASAIVYFSIIDEIHLKNHTLLYPIVTFLMLYGLKFHETIVNKLALVGRESMGIFLIHPFVIHFMHTLDPYSWLGAYGSIFLVALINLMIPLFIWLIINKFLSKVYRP